MRDVIFLGFCIDFNDFVRYSKTDKFSQTAAWKLESRYVAGLIDAGCAVTSIVSFAASTYPGNSKIFFGFSADMKPLHRTRLTVAFINLPGVKLLTRLLSTLMVITYALIAKPRSSSVVIYSLHMPYVIAGLLAKFVFQRKVFVIAPDMPIYMRTGYGGNKLVSILKIIDSKILRFASGFFDGACFICSAMQKEFPALSANSVIIDGIVDVTTLIHLPERTVNEVADTKVVLYTGMLTESYGVKLLVKAIDFLPSNFEIWIAGAGELANYIKQAGIRDARVKYLGLLTAAELSTAYSQTTLLINPRLLHESFVAFSFPSKLLEYLSTGIPVLTSKLPSIQDDLVPFLNFINDVTARGIASAIQSSCLLNYSSAVKVAGHAKSYVLATRSPKIQAEKLLSLMDS